MSTKAVFRDAGILFAITLIAGILLGFVYELTKEPIAEQEAAAKLAAYQEVFAEASEFVPIEFEPESARAVLTDYPKEDIDEVMMAVDEGGETIGYVITVTSHEGYGGDIQFSMGVQNDGTINGISFLSIAETAGLGMEAEPVLKPQFAGRNAAPYVVTKTGAMTESEIDAITSATITSKAVTNGVNAGMVYFTDALGGGADE